MKYAYIVALFCVLGCSQDDGPSEAGNRQRQAPVSVTLENFARVAGGNSTEYPLMCLPGKDFPEGREMTFEESDSGKYAHVVFPEAAVAPEKLDGCFVLHGHFQGIQNWDAFQSTDANSPVKVPRRDYRYFVVLSWEHRK